MVHESRHGVGNRSLIEVSIEYEAEHPYTAWRTPLLRAYRASDSSREEFLSIVGGKHCQEALSTECA